jgi:thioredoxin reductase
MNLADRTVVIVGGGPSGLSAATEIRRSGVGRVVVIEREEQAGGIPRHSDHLGYGIRDLRRVMSGPRYAARLVETATHIGVEMRTGTTALDVCGSAVTLADGTVLRADAVVLATGVRERPRAARLVPGDRPAGVFTTGSIQQLTALHHQQIGRNAVVVGAEHVSFSAILSLHHGGCRTVAMVTSLPRHQTYGLLRLATATLHRVPVHTGVGVAEVVGRGRVDAVVLTDGRRIACDTVVFTGDWIPDHELARRAGTVIDRGSRSPAVNSSFQTSQPGVFAIGNLVHPAETADLCALDGRTVAASICEWLVDGRWPGTVSPIAVVPPIAWAAPTPHGITLRVGEFVTGRLQASIDGETVWAHHPRRFVPNRAVHVDRPLPPGATLSIVPGR